MLVIFLARTFIFARVLLLRSFPFLLLRGPAILHLLRLDIELQTFLHWHFLPNIPNLCTSLPHSQFAISHVMPVMPRLSSPRCGAAVLFIHSRIHQNGQACLILLGRSTCLGSYSYWQL